MNVKRVNGSPVAFGAQVDGMKLSNYLLGKIGPTKLYIKRLHNLYDRLRLLGDKSDIIIINSVTEGIRNGKNVYEIKGKVNSLDFSFVQNSSTSNLNKLADFIEHTLKTNFKMQGADEAYNIFRAVG